MKKLSHAKSSMFFKLPCRKMLLTFPTSINNDIHVMQWPKDGFVIKAEKSEEEYYNVVLLDDYDKKKVLASFLEEDDAKSAVRDLFEGFQKKKLKVFFKIFSFSILAWFTTLILYSSLVMVANFTAPEEVLIYDKYSDGQFAEEVLIEQEPLKQDKTALSDVEIPTSNVNEGVEVQRSTNVNDIFAASKR